MGLRRANQRLAITLTLSFSRACSLRRDLEGLRAMAGMMASLGDASFRLPEGHGSVPQAAAQLASFLNANRGVAVLSGAGVSTESGIPDYRSPAGSYSKGHRPMSHDAFVFHERKQKQYWARSMAGWRPFSTAQPNDGHVALEGLQRGGYVGAIVTQNVDGLHQQAGSEAVVDLHGRNDRLCCLACGHNMPRGPFQDDLERLNEGWDGWRGTWEVRADGDAALQDAGEEVYDSFRVPKCPRCGGGPLKPDVTFFGDVVPEDVRERARQAVVQSPGLLIVGTSLSTLSAFRLVQEAAELAKPIAMVNIGKTRLERKSSRDVADKVSLYIEERCGPVLQETVLALETMKE